MASVIERATFSMTLFCFCVLSKKRNNNSATRRQIKDKSVVASYVVHSSSTVHVVHVHLTHYQSEVINYFNQVI